MRARQPGSPAVHRSQITEDQMPKQNDLTNELNTFIIVLNFGSARTFFGGGVGLKPVTKKWSLMLSVQKKKKSAGGVARGTARTGKVEIPKFSARDRADDKIWYSLYTAKIFFGEFLYFQRLLRAHNLRETPTRVPSFCTRVPPVHTCVPGRVPRVPASRLTG